ncbi:MAG: hypothetical protein HYZ49_17440 [Chloroflexi bacterium]|nr:hypothetical protein [Chloroflexota bacterium]
MTSVTAIVMSGPGGPGAIEAHLAAARRAALADVCRMLQQSPEVSQIIVAAPAAEQAQMTLPDSDKLQWDVDPPGGAFHFGERLTGIIQRRQLSRVLYLGAGGMPLLSADAVAQVVSTVAEAEGRAAVTNNVHSADWVAFTEAETVAGIADWLERDNMTAWRMRESAGYAVTSLPPSAATRLDIDTPFDLQVLALHSNTPPNLRRLLDTLNPELNLGPVQRAVEILRAPGSRVTMIGRVSATAWSLLESKARLWTRVLSEERGMVANRRQETGQVYSFVADHISRIGEAEFVARLAQTSDLVLFDTRVYLAHHQVWPSAADRFASDLGRPGLITDDRLRRLTEAVVSAPIPILLGGHNVVSGGLYALLEIAG